MAFEKFGNTSGTPNARSFMRVSLPLTALTLFISAFLLFSVQPFFAKMVLPKLGGTPAVWSVAMVFFQTVLLAGYGYAHLLTSRLPLRFAVAVHGIVLALAFVALPIAIPENWQSPPQDGQALWLMGLFTVSVGLPFFAVSANGPLLQAWFARTGHVHAYDPYFLYGASNIGSFASLILYVVLIEPSFDLAQQSVLWTGGYLVLAALILSCGFVAMRLNTRMHTSATVTNSVSKSAVSFADWAKWISLSFIPSALLVAVTAHVSTDIAAAPFLWIVPLALFLLTFVIVFQKQPVLPHRMMQKVMPVLAIPLLYLTVNPFVLPMSVGLTLHFLTFFVVAMTAHGTLAALRPQSDRLTEFYFAMSIGGVLGGIFASLIAMQLFSWIAEYPLLLLASLFVLPMMRGDNPKGQVLAALLTAIALVAFLSALRLAGVFNAFENFGNLAAVNGLLAIAAIYFLWREPKVIIVLSMAMFANTLVFMEYFNGTLSARSFFGVVRVEDNKVQGVRKFQHGTTLHGAMRLKDTDAASGRPMPLTYYTSDGGLATALNDVRKNVGGKLGTVGIVGVGAGSLACHMQAGENMDLIEIDPLVMKIANDPEKFRFLSECGQGAKQIIGDGRLVMTDIADGRYDTLIIDAFSSDSIPVHMMTTEAISLFMTKVKPGGLLVMHISNIHMELESVVAANAKVLGLQALAGSFNPVNSDETVGMATPSRVAVLARNDQDFGVLKSDTRWHQAVAGQTLPWTDGYSNLLAAIWRAHSG